MPINDRDLNEYESLIEVIVKYFKGNISKIKLYGEKIIN